jgi:nucleotide-binding universal stress UspA family protein
MATTSTLPESDVERRVVVGVSGSRASLAALATAVREAQLRDAVLHVVSVDEPRPPRAPYAPPSDAQPAPSTEVDVVRDNAVKLTPGVAVTYERLQGPAPRMLQLAAQGAELLVIGRSDYGDVLGRTNRADLIGPTARSCVAHAECPVLVVAPMAAE